LFLQNGISHQLYILKGSLAGNFSDLKGSGSIVKAVDVLKFWTMMKLWRFFQNFEQRGTKLSEVFGRFELEIFKVLEN